MAITKQLSGGGGLLSCLWWLTTFTFKLSALVAVVALLVTVHNMRNEAAESAVLLEKAQLEVAVATQQKQAATASHGETQTEINRLRTDLANSRSELQKVQVELSKKQEQQKEIDRKTKEAASAKQQALVLTQRVQELEADARRVQIQADQQLKTQVEALQGEKSSLQQKVEEQSAQLTAATEDLAKIKEELKNTGMKFVHAEKQREMLSAKEKAQDRAIEDLRATVRKLEAENKDQDDLLKSQLHQLKDVAVAKDAAEKQLTKAHETNAHVNNLWEQSKKDLEEVTKLKNGIESRLAQTLEQNGAVQTNMANEANTVKQEYENRLNQAVQLKEQFKDKLDEALQHNGELEKKLSAVENRFQEKENTHAAFEERMLAETSRVQQEAQNEVAALKQLQLRDAEEVMELRRQLSATGTSDSALNQRITRLESQLEKATTDYKTLETSSKEKIQTLETSVNKTREEWISATQWGETMKGMAERREGELRARENELAALKEDYEKQEKYVEELKNEMHLIVDHCQEKIATGESDLKECEKKRRQAKANWLDCDRQLQEANVKLQELERRSDQPEKVAATAGQ